MKDVFILGAGFSKAISSGMPTLAGLIRQQIGAVIEERTALEHFPIILGHILS